MVAEARKPIAFFASRFGEFRELRRRVFLCDDRIWVAEHSRPDLGSLPEPEKGERITDACLEKVREAEIFLCVVQQGYGEFQARIVRNPANVSLLEMEIFQALIDRKRLFLFLPNLFNPEPRLGSLIAVVQSIPSVVEFQFSSPEEILSKVSHIMRRSALWFGRMQSYVPTRLRNSLNAKTRSFLRSLLTQVGPSFLDGRFARHSDMPDRALIVLLLDRASETPDQARKLALLWMAIRHLCGAPYDNETYADFVPLWDRALSLWGSASAWYGFHGDHTLSRLAAVNTLLSIRSTASAREFAGSAHAEWIQGTKGTMASELYSLAKAMLPGKLRTGLFRKALSLIDEALSTARQDASGFRAIRGSILLRLGDIQGAIREYETVVELRSPIAFGPGAVGEALSELGYGYLCAGRYREAKECLEKGVELLASSRQHPFTVRARTKLAFYHFKSFDWPRGWVQLELAHETAVRENIRGFLGSDLGRFIGVLRRLTRVLNVGSPTR